MAQKKECVFLGTSISRHATWVPGRVSTTLPVTVMGACCFTLLMVNMHVLAIIIEKWPVIVITNINSGSTPLGVESQL